MLFLLFVQPAAAEENIADMRITYLPVVLKAGTQLDFSFSAGNRAGPECTGEIDYWIEKNGETLSQGKDSVFLGQGEVESGDGSMLLPSKLDGVYEFFIQMKCNDATVLANKTVEVKEILPAMPLTGNLFVSEGGEGKQMEFSYTIQTSLSEPVPIHLEEKIVSGETVLWTNSQNIAVTGSTEITRFGPALSAGNYRLLVEATHGSEIARIVREFEVKAAVPPLLPVEIPTSFLVGAALILLFGALGLAIRFFISRSRVPSYKAVLGKGHVLPALPKPKDRLCPVEAESSGVLEEYEMGKLLEDVGLSEKKREKAIAVAGAMPLTQLVRGCIVTDEEGRMSCETTVTVTLQNNTNRNWNKVLLAAEIPEFLAEKLSEVEADCEMHAVKGTGVARFLLPKVGAMQSSSISYKVGRMISQAEANSVPLPAVIKYRLGKPLVITQVRVVSQVKDAEKQAEDIFLKEKAISRKRKSKRRRK